jgi:hypothetical protein
MSVHNDTLPQTSTEPAGEPADASRRSFIQGALATGAALGSIGAASLAHAQTGMKRTTLSHYHIAASAETVHWGYFSKRPTRSAWCTRSSTTRACRWTMPR